MSQHPPAKLAEIEASVAEIERALNSGTPPESSDLHFYCAALLQALRGIVERLEEKQLIGVLNSCSWLADLDSARTLKVDPSAWVHVVKAIRAYVLGEEG